MFENIENQYLSKKNHGEIIHHYFSLQPKNYLKITYTYF